MFYSNFWDIVLNPTFGLTFGLVMLAFLPILLSVWNTWLNNGEIEGEETETE